MSLEEKFIALHPSTYAELKLTRKNKPALTDEEWKKLLEEEVEMAFEILTETQTTLFSALYNSNEEELHSYLEEILQAQEVSLDICLGPPEFWLLANPFSPAQSFITPEIRSQFWQVIEKNAGSYAEKVQWAIRTHQPFSLISGLLSGLESVHEIQIEKSGESTLLHEACAYLNLPVIKLLLGLEANINALDENLSTPIELICMQNHHEALLLLFQHSPSFEILLRALDGMPSYLHQIRMSLLKFISENYMTNDLSMNNEKKNILVLLRRYPSAFNTLLSCGVYKLPAVTLDTMNEWWKNLSFFSSEVLRKNPMLLVAPPLKRPKLK